MTLRLQMITFTEMGVHPDRRQGLFGLILLPLVCFMFALNERHASIRYIKSHFILSFRGHSYVLSDFLSALTNGTCYIRTLLA